MPAHVKPALIITVLVLVAQNLTAGKGTMWQAVGIGAAAYGGLFLSSKF